jgi:L-alanine-DL-glutamate epimerase-like enolase superfamily enzyme
VPVITGLEAIRLAIPFTHDGPDSGFGGSAWTKLECLLVRVSTDAGLTGWGEAFGYGAIPGTRALLEETIRPIVVGKPADDIAGLVGGLKRTLHVFGRSGPMQYALSGLDIALWDLAGKAAGLPSGGCSAAPRYTTSRPMRASSAYPIQGRSPCPARRRRGGA